jgi:hypothetical protein
LIINFTVGVKAVGRSNSAVSLGLSIQTGIRGIITITIDESDEEKYNNSKTMQLAQDSRFVRLIIGIYNMLKVWASEHRELYRRNNYSYIMLNTGN